MKKWLLAVGLVLMPVCALAQVVYTTMTPTESAYLYMGLGMQWTLRTSPSMLNIPSAVVICGVFYLLVRRMTSANPEPLVSIIMYFITTLMISVLFWPESVGPLVKVNRTIYPNAISALTWTSGGSPGATTPDYNNAQERLRNVESQHLLPGGAWPFDFHGNLMTMTSTEVPPAFHLFLDAVIDMPLKLAVALNEDAKKPFLQAYSFQGLYGVPLGDHIEDLLNVEGIACFMQGLDHLAASGNMKPADLEWKSHLPWLDPMFELFVVQGPAMSTDVKTEFYRAGIIAGNITDGSVPCINVWGTIKTKVDEILQGPVRPGASDRIRQVIHTNTHLTAAQQRDLLLYRHMENFAPAAVVSTTTQNVLDAGMDIATAQAVSRTPEVVKSGASGVASGVGVVGKVAGGIAGLVSGLMGASKLYLDQFMGFIKPALMLIYFMPHITGMMSAVSVGMFPFVVIWSLFPGQHFKPLANYFLVLLFTHSSPLWYAIADAMTQFAYRSIGGNQTAVTEMEAVLNFVEGNVIGIFVGVFSLFVVPAIEAIILFGAWRAIGSSLKS